MSVHKPRLGQSGNFTNSKERRVSKGRTRCVSVLGSRGVKYLMTIETNIVAVIFLALICFGEYGEAERIQIIRKWESPDQAEDKEPQAEQKKIFAKPKIVTVDGRAGAFSQSPGPQKGNGEKPAIFYNEETKS